MTTLVVQMHPLDDSFNTAVLDSVVQGLGAAGVSHQIARLCRGERPNLDGVDHLVFVYPTWWGGIPAELLDWMQTTLAPHVDGGVGPSPLASVGSVTIVTTHGSSKTINLAQGQPGLQTWKRVVVPLCAPGASFDWVALYKIDRTTPEERQAFLDRVRGHFAGTAASPAR